MAPEHWTVNASPLILLGKADALWLLAELGGPQPPSCPHIPARDQPVATEATNPALMIKPIQNP